DFALDPTRRWHSPDEVTWRTAIVVPFAPETRASGVGEAGFFQRCWYRRRIDPPALGPDERLVLHFGAVDYAATVWVDGDCVVHHEGGYTPFSADLGARARPGRPLTIVVCVDDDPHELSKPRGKQDWKREPHVIWYPRTSGIWQTVWMERVPATAIAGLVWTPNLERWEIGFEARLDGAPRHDLRLAVRLHVGDLVLAEDVYALTAGEVTRRIALSDPGIDDFRNELLWSPASPTLIDAEVRLVDADGTVIDDVRSYTALRAFTLQGDRTLLNGRPYGLRLVLDQGYWRDTGLTAPDDAALRRDVELAKEMGFNGVRKHQKIEDPRYLYWADRLGLLVWEEMPSAYRFTRTAIERLTREWLEAIARDVSHPCIVAWVPFNESWGVPNLPEIPAQRHFVQALYHLTHTIDPTRPVIGNDGWESIATDIVGIHDYDQDVERLARRYETDEVIPHLFRRERPGGRLLALDGHEHAGQPIVLTEFGGIVCAPDRARTWGHARATGPADFAAQYEALLATIHRLTLFAGFCYTQFADTYQEANGLLSADRVPKFPLDAIRRATRGPRTARQEEAELENRERMAEFHRLHRVPLP
ncbi:MAG TPA: glycoside hydrolase family 2 TIM barrel-domain containing protein, partial [Candidatus Binatia bacterium]|nr:glycoside hydrolase family 2 TIM barrel-domain containing protein [Candidatus Binatia bacterium]